MTRVGTAVFAGVVLCVGAGSYWYVSRTMNEVEKVGFVKKTQRLGSGPHVVAGEEVEVRVVVGRVLGGSTFVKDEQHTVRVGSEKVEGFGEYGPQLSALVSSMRRGEGASIIFKSGNEKILLEVEIPDK